MLNAKIFTLAALFVVLMSNVYVGRAQTSQSDTVWSKYIGSEVLQVKFSPDGNSIYVGASGRKPIVLSTESGEIIREYEQSFTSVTAMDLSKDGKMLLVGGGSRNVEIINTETGLIKKLIIPDEINKLYDKMIIYSASISADQKECCIVTTGSNKDLEREGHVIIWNLSTLTYYKSIGVGFAKRARYSPNDKLLAVCYEAANYQCPIELFETENYQKLSTLGYHSSITEDISFSPDGSLLASCGWDGYIKIWDVKERKLVRESLFENINDLILTLKFTNDSKMLFVGGGNWKNWYIKSYDVNDFKEIHKYFYNHFYIDSEGPISLDSKVYNNKTFIASGSSRGLVLLNTDWITSITEIHKKTNIIKPNPSSSITQINLNIIFSDNYNIEIFNDQSTLINALYSGFLKTGEYNFNWDSKSCPSGTYFCIIKSNNYSDTLKIIVQK